MRDGGPGCWLSLLGKSGTGKTHCAKVLWDKLHRRFTTDHLAYIPHIVYWPRWIEELRNLVSEGYGTGKLLDMTKWPLLVLDDIGSERDSTGFATEKLSMLLGSRVRKWTILTSNCDMEQLWKLDGRIADRIRRERGNQYIDLRTQSYATRSH